MRSHTITSFILLLAISALLSSCSITKFITRTEKENYHVVNRDTTVIERVHNLPGTTQDTSRPAPSSRTTTLETYTSERDSVVPHDYPNFLRLGVVELAGIYAGGSGPGGGLFGAYALGNENFSRDFFNHSELFRAGTVEIRLRWFDDAPNWTFGTSAFEHWAMDDSSNHSFTSVIGGNQYIRRRFFLRDQIPYVILQPFLGISEYPSAYINIGGELHVGSLGGLNLRAYAGLITGFDWAFPSTGGTFPYFAIGVSALDYTNRLEETFREWSQYTKTTVSTCVVDVSGGSKWLQSRFASVQFPLPLGNHHGWIGTSMLNYIQFDADHKGLGVLPVSAGYRQYVGTDWFIEPYVEASYYPSTFANAALRVKIPVGNAIGLGGVIGFATGSPGAFGEAKDNAFSGPYFGISIFAGDWNNTPEKIGELRADEIPSTMK